jgi:hypothetical protein
VKTYSSSALKDIASESVYVRSHEARNSSRGDVLARLAKDTDERVINLVATNPNTPLDVLQELAHDPYAVVRRGITINPSAPTDLILKAAGSLEDFSGEIELCLEIDYDNINDMGGDEAYRKVSMYVHDYLRQHGYEMYSDAFDGDCLYYCRCGKFDSLGDVNVCVQEVSDYVTARCIYIHSQSAERLLG